ncbi:hypothetical protein DCMF_25965 [Candidatus Formimonas warabiya]|uniref:Uncharacterized protein n=1 Tax=Formimonas warabiya TaxID=1761012 RepID=A0A3G1KZC6_FORW1|nr:hypothetical protein DCMF_25965 [Candidatus Formimonas warabiya]
MTMENSEVIKTMVGRLNLMMNLLQAVKTDSPLGRTLRVLIHLSWENEKQPLKGQIEYEDLLTLSEDIAQNDLEESLNYLLSNGIISIHYQNK